MLFTTRLEKEAIIDQSLAANVCLRCGLSQVTDCHVHNEGYERRHCRIVRPQLNNREPHDVED